MKHEPRKTFSLYPLFLIFLKLFAQHTWLWGRRTIGRGLFLTLSREVWPICKSRQNVMSDNWHFWPPDWILQSRACLQASSWGCSLLSSCSQPLFPQKLAHRLSKNTKLCFISEKDGPQKSILFPYCKQCGKANSCYLQWNMTTWIIEASMITKTLKTDTTVIYKNKC